MHGTSADSALYDKGMHYFLKISHDINEFLKFK